MLQLFRPVPVYVKVYPNAISITRLQTGDTVHRTAAEPFSNTHLVVANFGLAERLGREIIKDLGLSRRSLKTMVQQMKVYEDVLSEVEKRILRDLCEQMGSKAVFVITNEKELSNEEALQVLNEN
ncbi:MAG: hypothetical protein EOO15_24330 [Chitinophagaceae bacterium]|nr:MAG: hypothetical protein EOO15_24330 [Chitinophagaceae bacterium]